MEDQVFLYVEDDALSREALSVILQRIMKVKHLYLFEDSSAFVERVQALPMKPSIILLDIHMNPLSGFEMLKILRGELGHHNTKIIALTASVMNEEVELLKASGFDGVIGKPINVAIFPSLIQRVTDGETIWHVTDLD